MPAGTDRYPAPLDPGAQLEERLRALEQQVNALQARNPLNNAVFSGTLRSANPTTGDTTLEITGTGIEAFDALGGSVFNLDEDGLTIPNGAITVGGGPVRALDIDYDEAMSINVSLTTTEASFAPATITVPTWAQQAVVFGWTVFQMSNGSGATQLMQMRCDIDGQPGTGVWSQTCDNGAVENTQDMNWRTLTGGSLGATITVDSAASINTGTNSTNIIRTKALAYFFR